MCELSERVYAVCKLLGYNPPSPLFTEELIDSLTASAMISREGEARDANLLVKIKEGRKEIFVRID